MPVTQDEFEQAESKFKEAYDRWNQFMDQDPTRAIDVEASEATDEEKRLIIDSAQTNMDLLPRP